MLPAVFDDIRRENNAQLRAERLDQALQDHPWRLTDFFLLDHRDLIRVEALSRIAGNIRNPGTGDLTFHRPLPYRVRLKTIDGLPVRIKTGHKYLERTARQITQLVLQGREVYEYTVHPAECVLSAADAIQVLYLHGVGIAFPEHEFRKSETWRQRARVVEVSQHAWTDEEPGRDPEAEAKCRMPEAREDATGRTWAEQLARYGSKVLLGVPGVEPAVQKTAAQARIEELQAVAAAIRGDVPQAAPAPKRRGRPRREAAPAG